MYTIHIISKAGCTPLPHTHTSYKMRPLGSFNMELFGIEVLFAGSLVLGAYTIIKLLTGDGSSPNVANANQAIIPGSARLLSEGDTAAFKGHTIRRKVLTTEEVPYDQPVGA